MSQRAQRLILVIALLAWLALAWFGISGGIGQLSAPMTIGQRIQTVAQLGYGAFALLTPLAMLRLRRFTGVAKFGWLLTVTLAAGLAPVVWGGTGIGPGIIAGVSGLGIGVLLLWMLSVGSRRVVPLAEAGTNG